MVYGMPRIVDHSQRRTEIVYAVWALVAEQGIDAVTMRRVAAQAGVSLGQVQHYFASKEQLLQHACRAIVDLSAGHFAERTSDLSTLETIRALLLQPIPRDPVSRAGVAVWQAFLTRAASDPGIRDIVLDAVDGACRELTRMITQAQLEGALHGALDAARTARSLFALSYGLSQQVLIDAVGAEEAAAAAEATLAALTSNGPSRR